MSVKKKKEVEETCVQVKGFFNGDVEKDLQILVNAVWFLCLLSCLAVEEEEEEESCRVCCVCQINKSSIPKSYFVKIRKTFSLLLRLFLLLHMLLLLLLPLLLSIHALQFAFLSSFLHVDS